MAKDQRSKPSETIERTRLAMKLTEIAVAQTRRAIEDSRRLIRSSRGIATGAPVAWPLVPCRLEGANDNQRPPYRIVAFHKPCAGR